MIIPALGAYLAYRAGKKVYDNEKQTNDANSANRQLIQGTGSSANQFADQGQAGYGAMTAEAAQAREGLRRIATGKQSYSGEALRQGAEQNMAAQRSMAASASPQNAPMAARTAMMNNARIGAGMSGAAALAGIQERNAAQQAYMNSILQQRQQDSGVALGSRQNAVNAFGGVPAEQSFLDRYSQPITGAFGAAAKFSDKRLKEDIEDGSDDANRAMKGLRSFTYKYKDKKLGADRELGIMAQDLERAGLKHTVIDTPKGKAVHGAALATANTSMLAALEKRVARIEKGKK